MDDLNAPVVLTTFAHEMEAGVLINALEQHGVRAKSTGELVAGFRAEVPGDVKVLVSNIDLDRARRVMSEIQAADPGDVDWSQVDVGQASDQSQPPRPLASFNRDRILKVGLTVMLGLFALGILWQALKAFGF